MPSSISRAPQQLLGQGGHVVGEALSDGGHFLQALALGGGSTGNLIGGDVRKRRKNTPHFRKSDLC